MHLRYCMLTAHYERRENRHPQIVMKELGITYQHSTPQSMGDQWWFWNCENLPEELPEFLTELKLKPNDCVGFGLSKEDAIKISKYQKSRK